MQLRLIDSYRVLQFCRRILYHRGLLVVRFPGARQLPPNPIEATVPKRTQDRLRDPGIASAFGRFPQLVQFRPARNVLVQHCELESYVTGRVLQARQAMLPAANWPGREASTGINSYADCEVEGLVFPRPQIL